MTEPPSRVATRLLDHYTVRAEKAEREAAELRAALADAHATIAALTRKEDTTDGTR